ncbi:MAG: excisionase family DNA-binding protein, partial [Acidimicrobiia bacterium]|nr:excisionase family DNA-binding protein [Acidimicrobiia bacterium]
MNLKEAASRLEVHYQTAYKWVQSGALGATRVGGRYEVTEAAVERLAARRRAARTDGIPIAGERESFVARDDLLAEFATMAMEPFLSLRSVAAFATRRGAELFGDLCVVMLLGENGVPGFVTVEDPDAGRAAEIRAIIDLLGQVSVEFGSALSTFVPENVLRVSHVPQDEFRDRMRPEIRRHLTLRPIRSLLVAPLECEGQRLGGLTLARSESDRPYTKEDEAFVRRMAEGLGPLIQAAADVQLSFRLRGNLVAGLKDLIARNPGPDGVPEEAVEELFRRHAADSRLAVTLLDADRRFLAANDAVGEIAGVSSPPIKGRSFASYTDPRDQEADQASFAPLISGELDFVDLNVRRLDLEDGDEYAYTSHRAAVRGPDARLRYFVTVVRSRRMAQPDD